MNVLDLFSGIGGFTIGLEAAGMRTVAFCENNQFCREVLEGAGVAITPGLDFGRHRAAEHVRFAYTIAQAKLEDGVARLARFLRTPT
jgi:aspartate/methionine/tyrosine aminotransferase